MNLYKQNRLKETIIGSGRDLLITYCSEVRPWLTLIAAAMAWTPSSCNRLAVRLTHTHTHISFLSAVRFRIYVKTEKWLFMVGRFICSSKCEWKAKRPTTLKHAACILGTCWASTCERHSNCEATHSRNWRDLFSYSAWAMFFAPSTPMEFSLKLKEKNSLSEKWRGIFLCKSVCVRVCVCVQLDKHACTN